MSTPYTAPTLHTPSPGDEAPVDWHNDAVCAQVDPELFYPERGRATKVVRKICFSCPVRLMCLEAAMDEESGERERFGFRGGLSPAERTDLAEKRGEPHRAGDVESPAEHQSPAAA